MTKPVALGRLREISRQRSIRRPLLMVVPKETAEEQSTVPDALIEWPLPG